MIPIRVHNHKHPTFRYNILTDVIRISITGALFLIKHNFFLDLMVIVKRKKEYYFAYCTISLKFILKSFNENVLTYYNFIWVEFQIYSNSIIYCLILLSYLQFILTTTVWLDSILLFLDSTTTINLCVYNLNSELTKTKNPLNIYNLIYIECNKLTVRFKYKIKIN